MDGRLACHRDRLALLFAKPTTTTHRDRAAAAAAEQCHLALVCGGGGVDRAGLSEGAPVGHSPSSSASDMKETTELLPETRDNKIAATVETDLSSPAEIAASDTIRRRLWMQRVVNVRVAETEMKRAHVASVIKAARTWIPVRGRSNRNRSSTGNDAGRGAIVNVGTRSGVDEPPTHRVSMAVSSAEGPVSTEARGLGKDVEDEIAAKAEIFPSPANTVAGDTILQSGEQRIQIVCAAEAEMNWRVASHCVATEATMEDETHPCHLAGRHVNGNRAGTGTTAVKEGPGVGVDEQPTKKDDVAGAGKTSSSAISEGNEGKPRPERAVLESGSKERKVAVGAAAAATASGDRADDVESHEGQWDTVESRSIVMKVVAGLLLIFVVAMALSGTGLLRYTSSSLGESGGILAPAASHAAAGSQQVSVEQSGADTLVLPVRHVASFAPIVAGGRHSMAGLTRNTVEDTRKCMAPRPAAAVNANANIARKLVAFKEALPVKGSKNDCSFTCIVAKVPKRSIKAVDGGGTIIMFIANESLVVKAKAADGNTDKGVSGGRNTKKRKGTAAFDNELGGNKGRGWEHADANGRDFLVCPLRPLKYATIGAVHEPSASGTGGDDGVDSRSKPMGEREVVLKEVPPANASELRTALFAAAEAAKGETVSDGVGRDCDMNNPPVGFVVPKITAAIKTTLLLQEATNDMPSTLDYSYEYDIEGSVVPHETTMVANGTRIAFTEPLAAVRRGRGIDSSDQTGKSTTHSRISWTIVLI